MAGYSVVATSALIQHCDGVALFYRDSPNFSVEVIRQFSANVIACQLATGEWRWYIVGCYLTLVERVTIQDVEAAMKECPRGMEIVVTGDLNADLERTVATERLEDLSRHFLPQRHTW